MRTNVLIFNHGYKDGFIEASNQYTQLFNKTNYHVTVIYLDGEAREDIRNKHVADTVLFLNTTSQEKRGLKLQTIKKILRLHKINAYQIVICHRYKPTYIMLWVAKFYKIPIFISVMHEMKTFKNFSRRLTLKLLGQKNMMLAGVSNAVRDDLKNTIFYPHKNRIVTLYNAIDIDFSEKLILSREESRSILKINKHDFVFGILGRLVPAKDHKTLIEAFAFIKPQCPNAKLIIIGEGEMKSTLDKQIANAGLAKVIILTGFMPHASNLLKAFDVFVLSSVKEAFGRVLLEAMLAKCPIIATKTDGIPEVLNDVGILVEKRNPSALATAMVSFYEMSNHERELQSIRSYHRAISTFSIASFKEFFWKLPIFQI